MHKFKWFVAGVMFITIVSVQAAAQDGFGKRE